MTQLLDAKVEEALQSLMKTVELIAQYGDDDLKKAEPFETMVESLINAKNDGKKAEKAIEAAKDKHTIAEYDNAFSNEYDKSSKFKATSTDEYKRFMTQTGTLLTANIEEEQSTSVVQGDDFRMEIEVSDIDPLTKLRMTNPVKNSICGHYYEKSTILESIQVNPKLRCPIAGCGNNRFVTKAHLVDDPIFRLKLQRRNENN